MPAITNYLDFDLLVESDVVGYRSRVLASPGGQAVSSFELPFTPLELENFLLRVGLSLGEIRRDVRRIDSSMTADIKSFGGKLFGSVFDERLLPLLVRSLDEARRQEAGLRLRIRMSDVPELADVPWEYLYDSTANRFLNLSVGSPVVRYLELSEPAAPLTVTLPLRVLVMISGPSDVRPLDVDVEWERIIGALSDLEERGMVVVERLESASLAALQIALRRGEYHVLHFVGHGGYDEGSEDGVLVLEGMDGRARAVSAQDLGTLLRDHRTLRLVILNSCEGARSSPTDPFAGAAQSLVRQGIPAVIAMQFEITDQAAITLSHEFYSALSDGYQVDAALGEARKAIFAAGNEVEWGTPVLYMRAPDGVIFRMEEQERTGDLPGASGSGTPSSGLDPMVPRVGSRTPAAVPRAGPVHVSDDAVPASSGPAAALDVAPGTSPPEPPDELDPPPTTPVVIGLAVAGAVLLLISSLLPASAISSWFLPAPILAAAGALAVAVRGARSRAPRWAGGALVGSGGAVVAAGAFFLVIPDKGVQAGIVGAVAGGLLLVAGGAVEWWRSSRRPPAAVGWVPAVGAGLVALGSLLPVTGDEGPLRLTDMAEWTGVGGRMSILAPLLGLSVVLLVASPFPTHRVAQQSGLVAALAIQLVAAFVSLAGYSVAEYWGLGPGLWLALVGGVVAAMGVVVPPGFWRRAHAADSRDGPRDHPGGPEGSAGSPGEDGGRPHHVNG